MDNKIPPGHIIDGDAEQQAAADALGDMAALQGLSTALLVGRTIVYASTQGDNAVFSVRLDDGTSFSFKMIGFSLPAEKAAQEQRALHAAD